MFFLVDVRCTPAKRSLEYEMKTPKKQKYEPGQFDDVPDVEEEENTSRTTSVSAKSPGYLAKSPGSLSDTSVDSMASTELPEPLELPSFTPAVRGALRDGECDGSVWNMVSSENN